GAAVKVCDFMVAFHYGLYDLFTDFGRIYGFDEGSDIACEIYAEGEMLVPHGEESYNAVTYGGMALQGSGMMAAQGGIYYMFKRVEEVYFYTSNTNNANETYTIYLCALTSNAEIGLPFEDIPGVKWGPVGTDNKNSKNLVQAKVIDMPDNFVSVTAIGLCDVDWQASINGRELGRVRIVSANKITNPSSFEAVAKYDNTYGHRRPDTTKDVAKRVSLKPGMYDSPNLKVVGEHGNFWLAHVWERWDSFPLFRKTVLRFVEKNKAGKTDPVEKQNISKVVWPVKNAHNCSSNWGWRHLSEKDPVRFHLGSDVGAANVDALAIMDGVVVLRGYFGARGYTIALEHNVAGIGKFYTLYQHLQNGGRPAMDTKINAGDPVGIVGNSGDTNVPYDYHLHFELMKTLPNPSTFSGQTTTAQTINPLSEYCGHDTRSVENYLNPNPFFKWNLEKQKYEFSTTFGWNYDEPDPNSTLPKFCSHHTDYRTHS
ncbi:MAG: M23 family metallopeptidase, partial [Dehalococcoidia bacterium]|nr:M23 family metallopeptidase [Dehalococcoidia bacterium]